MRVEWLQRPLGELTQNFDSLRIPVKAADRRPGPYPYYGASGVVDHVDHFIFDGEYLLIAEDGENLRSRKTPIAFLARGKFWVNNHAHIVRGNAEADTRFLMYALSRTDISGYLTGSTIPKLTQGNLNRISLLAPPLHEQRAIAHTLGTLDDKIDLNRRLSETLEGMARALFRSWFLDFDPVRAKMDGRWQPGESLPGLPADLYNLFPDRLVESVLGQVPQGWEVGCLDDFVEAERGLSYSGKHLADKGVPMHNLNSILEGGGYKYEGMKFYAGEYRDRHRVSAGDLVVANTEQGHDRLLIGYAAIVPGRFGAEGIFSHHLYRVSPKGGCYLSRFFLCHLFNSGPMQQVVSGYANGTTVNMLPPDALQLPQFVVPPEPIVARFTAMAQAVHGRQEELVLESDTLAELRDALLPKLISGDLPVPDVERFVRGDAS